MVYVLKLYIPSPSGIPEIRRLTLNSSTLSSHVALVEKIVGSVPKLEGKCFELCWKDNEGEDISITDDNDLAQTVANLEDDVLKIYIRLNGPDVLSFQTKTIAGDEHPHVKCDGCNLKIIGLRYKCLQCHDYDLCSDCNYAGKHPYHDMLKLVSPSTFPRHWSFNGWKKFFKSLFGFDPVTDVIDRSDSSGKQCPYLASLNHSKNNLTKEATSKCKKEVSDQTKENSSKKSEPSTPKKPDDIQFPPGFPFFSNPNGSGPNDCPKFQENMFNYAENACSFINQFLKPFGADLRVEVDPSQEKTKATQEEVKNDNSQSERTVPINIETSATNATESDNGARPKSRSPSFETSYPKMSHGLFTHTNLKDSGISNVETNNTPKSTTNESGDSNVNKNESLIDITSQELSGNAEGWTVINSCNVKSDSESSLPEVNDKQEKKSSSEEIIIINKPVIPEAKYPTMEEISSINAEKVDDTKVKYVDKEAATAEPPKSTSKSFVDEIEDISKLDPEVANALLKMRAMGFTNEGGWLLRLLQAKKGNIYHVLDSLYPNESRNE